MVCCFDSLEFEHAVILLSNFAFSKSFIPTPHEPFPSAPPQFIEVF